MGLAYSEIGQILCERIISRQILRNHLFLLDSIKNNLDSLLKNPVKCVIFALKIPMGAV